MIPIQQLLQTDGNFYNTQTKNQLKIVRPDLDKSFLPPIPLDIFQNTCAIVAVQKFDWMINSTKNFSCL